MKKALFLFMAAALVACATVAGGGEFTRHYSGSLFQVARDGRYSVELMVLGGELATGANSADVIVHGKGDVEVMGASVRVTPWMPEMGHGVRDKPVVRERGGGLYSVENIDITMPGRWQLKVEVEKDGLRDEAVFEFPDVRKAEGAAGRSGAEEAPKALDYSQSRTSEKGAFQVMVRSKSEPVPVNEIHAWLLTVKTPEGRPVEDALVSVGGEMPEHGHGMPTRPMVTANLGGGVYLVEGMKFQMPGWWVVSFRIKAGETEDSVSFNLQVR
ncbi:MAG: hypothetical protein Kow0025_24990 [Thermodesulfovibrionales bacterium]